MTISYYHTIVHYIGNALKLIINGGVLMQLNLNGNKPLYIQIAEGIEEDIIDNILQEGEKAYSQYQVAGEYGINPATAAKGIKLLEQESVLFKKRGLGMFVSEGAKNVILEKRKDIFETEIIAEMLKEAGKLGLKKEDIIKIIHGIKEV